MKKVTDIFGEELNVGDFVLVPGNSTTRYLYIGHIAKRTSVNLLVNCITVYTLAEQEIDALEQGNRGWQARVDLTQAKNELQKISKEQVTKIVKHHASN